jgi:flagellar hook-basal body complex protein FliE
LFGSGPGADAANSPPKRRQFAPSRHAGLATIQPCFKEVVCHAVAARRPGNNTTMNVTLKPFDFAQAVARAGLGTDGQPLARSKAVEGPGFQQVLTQALGAVSQAQNDATAMQREVQMDNPSVSLEQTMVAMQKAQVGFQATLAVRNRLVQAYSDIMNMQV